MELTFCKRFFNRTPKQFSGSTTPIVLNFHKNIAEQPVNDFYDNMNLYCTNARHSPIRTRWSNNWTPARSIVPFYTYKVGAVTKEKKVENRVSHKTLGVNMHNTHTRAKIKPKKSLCKKNLYESIMLSVPIVINGRGKKEKKQVRKIRKYFRV